MQETMLKYYKTEPITGSENALGHINLTPDTRIFYNNNKGFIIETPKRIYNLMGGTSKEAVSWVAILQEACNTSEMFGLDTTALKNLN